MCLGQDSGSRYVGFPEGLRMRARRVSRRFSAPSSETRQRTKRALGKTTAELGREQGFPLVGVPAQLSMTHTQADENIIKAESFPRRNDSLWDGFANAMQTTQAKDFAFTFAGGLVSQSSIFVSVSRF